MTKQKVQKPKNMSTKKNARIQKFGPVTTISTAPVAIGNSIRGSEPVIRQTADGVRVVGRDFCFALSSTGSAVTGWELIGGMPLTPCVLASSSLRSFTQSYANFKVNRVIFHYITSSPTSQAGDVLFYYNRDRLAPCPDYSNSNFLPMVLSDSKTILGPQWTNHSAVVTPAPDWKSTSFALQSDLNEDAAGEIFFYSKTNAVNSPGYMIMDYDITFRELSVNPRAGSLPIARGLFTQTALGVSALATTAGTTAYVGSGGWIIRGNSIANAAAAAPTGLQAGDVYKCVVSATASSALNTFTACTLSNLLRFADDSSTPYAIDDGFTFYAAWDGSSFRIAPNFMDAVTNARNCVAGVTGTISFALCVNMTLVGVTTSAAQASY